MQAEAPHGSQARTW